MDISKIVGRKFYYKDSNLVKIYFTLEANKDNDYTITVDDIRTKVKEIIFDTDDIKIILENKTYWYTIWETSIANQYRMLIHTRKAFSVPLFSVPVEDNV